MRTFYAKQFKIGSEVIVHAFKTMQARDEWVERNYDLLGARQCSEAEAKSLAKPEDFIGH